MSVDIAPGSANIGLTTSTYPSWGFLPSTDNETVTAADPSNPRHDIVVAYRDLSVISSASVNNPGAMKFAVVAGTPAGSPSDPSSSTIQAAVGASNPWIKLARITLPANAPSVVNSYLTDLRQPIALMGGLYGGNLNTNGHTVPNAADGMLTLLNLAQTWTAAQTFSAGLNINGFNIAGAWQNWTPTFTNLSGGTLNYATYMQIGKTIFWKLSYTLAGAGVSGAIAFTLPATANSNNDTRTIIGQGNANVTSGAFTPVVATFNGNFTQGLILALNAASTYLQAVNTSSSVPITWASGSQLAMEGFYEAA